MNAIYVLSFGGFVAAAVVAYGLTWVARFAAPRLGFVDVPDGRRKKHQRATPLLGGVAVYGALIITLPIVLYLMNAALPRNWGSLTALAVSGGLFCLLGLWDDRHPLRAGEKFLGQIMASLPYAIWGVQVVDVQLAGYQFNLGVWSHVFAVVWLVSCANVVNLVDGLDGLASSVGLIAMGTLALISIGGYDPVMPLVTFVATGSIAGFLIHNWPPAKIFLGDSGSLSIGYLVGAVAIEASSKTTAGFMLTFPLALLAVPILDTAMAILRRKLTGRAIGIADRGHIHHRLEDRGLTKLQTLLAIVGISATMALACLLAVKYEQDLIVVVVCVGMIATIIAGRIFGLHEMSLVLRHFEIFHSALAQAVRDLTVRRMVVHLENSEPSSPDVLWTTVLTRVERVGGDWLELRCRSDRDDEEIWMRSSRPLTTRAQGIGNWRFEYTVYRDDGLSVAFAARGTRDAELTSPSFDQLTHLFEACVRQLPEIAAIRETEPSRAILPLSEVEPFDESVHRLGGDRQAA
ncbi:MAG: undecaprenyl/decaprenyl-phosphate alpha-N-acetylglucosaminyl 1-phosphate transferase [Planctomycetota bacterium]|nr:MAG: undecaprenyl/decaprenyl-phosphate alpha-N-acetylglucosaminyl 1-phosphate transferase [Planctomycetota bacterium]REK46566.1 MAG: undecaprenyl/decaprenyl-phosphate alpha-N-acetylglucosaminyl 1-phosphate transferase [Planctomycetota bacterium]